MWPVPVPLPSYASVLQAARHMRLMPRMVLLIPYVSIFWSQFGTCITSALLAAASKKHVALCGFARLEDTETQPSTTSAVLGWRKCQQIQVNLDRSRI
jgi:hypothetical protein